jgi:hypothetical protein
MGSVERAQPTFIGRKKGGVVMHTTTLGIDVAKNVFQLHGVDARGRAVFSRRLKRNQLLHTVARLCRRVRSGWRRAGVRSTGVRCLNSSSIPPAPSCAQLAITQAQSLGINPRMAI